MGRKAKQIVEPLKKTFDQIVKAVGRYKPKPLPQEQEEKQDSNKK